MPTFLPNLRLMRPLSFAIFFLPAKFIKRGTTADLLFTTWASTEYISRTLHYLILVSLWYDYEFIRKTEFFFNYLYIFLNVLSTFSIDDNYTCPVHVYLNARYWKAHHACIVHKDTDPLIDDICWNINRTHLQWYIAILF